MIRNSILLLAWVNLAILCALLLVMNGRYARNAKDTFVHLFGLYWTELSYNTPTYDEHLMKSNELYPICHKLVHTGGSGDWFVSSAAEREYYRVLLQSGSMICGKEHRMLRFLKSRKDRPLRQWTDGCVEGIAAAKHRMHDYLQELCADQQQANAHYQSLLKLRRSPCQIYDSLTDNVQVEINTDASLSIATLRANAEANKRSEPQTYGIVYTGEPKHFRRIHQSIMSLLLSNSTRAIPTVEVWVNYYALSRCKQVFQSFPSVRCMVFSRNSNVQEYGQTHSFTHSKTTKPVESAVVTGFEAKFHALLQTALHHVLFLDADNVVTRDVSEVFRNPGYLHTGALLWPDFWGAACDDTNSIRSGHTATKEFVLFVAQFPGLSPGTHTVPDYYQYTQHKRHEHQKKSAEDLKADNSTNKSVSANTSHASHPTISTPSPSLTTSIYRSHIRQYSQEAETGQIVINLTRHRGLLRLALHMIQDKAFFQRLFNGDKDLFRFMFFLTGVPFHFNEHLPGISVTQHMKKDCIVHFHDPDAQRRHPSNHSYLAVPPLFFHQLKQREPDAFRRYLLPPLLAHKQASYCVTTNKHIAGANSSGLELHVPEYGNQLVQYAEKLFNISDKEWNKIV